MARRLSPQTGAVLLALVDEPDRWRYGYELGNQIALRAGSLYPILIRLHDRGMLEECWEVDPPAGRPPRHLYRLTAPGRQAAAELQEAAAPTDATRAVRAQRRHQPRTAS